MEVDIANGSLLSYAVIRRAAAPYDIYILSISLLYVQQPIDLLCFFLLLFAAFVSVFGVSISELPSSLASFSRSSGVIFVESDNILTHNITQNSTMIIILIPIVPVPFFAATGVTHFSTHFSYFNSDLNSYFPVQHTTFCELSSSEIS